ncbi:hypothetical protein V6N13_110413 [Hibiscus sabdariffa]|uniref:Uncharacterized protein n=1 Tax=Hibiscus sabdariffa TaxID=183260 RepID=A0ABR2THQ8_9ROSI
MAGLQYSFFPTDFFYPRPPQPTNGNSITPSTPAVQKREAEAAHGSSKQPRNKSSLSMRRTQGQKLGRIYIQNRGEGDQFKLPRNSVSWLILIPDGQEHSDSS